MAKKKEKIVEQEEPKQLDLEIKEPFKNKFYKAKRKFDFAVLKLEVIKFLKDPLVWATLMISIIMIVFQIEMILRNLNNIPTYLPIFKFYTSVKKGLIESKYLYIFPGLSALILLLTMMFVSRNYNREKNLTKLLLTATLVATLLLSVTLIQLIRI